MNTFSLGISHVRLLKLAKYLSRECVNLNFVNVTKIWIWIRLKHLRILCKIFSEMSGEFGVEN